MGSHVLSVGGYLVDVLREEDDDDDGWLDEGHTCMLACYTESCKEPPGGGIRRDGVFSWEKDREAEGEGFGI